MQTYEKLVLTKANIFKNLFKQVQTVEILTNDYFKILTNACTPKIEAFQVVISTFLITTNYHWKQLSSINLNLYYLNSIGVCLFVCLLVCLFVCRFVRIVLEYSGIDIRIAKNVLYLWMYGAKRENMQIKYILTKGY